ncbi:flagellar biosynthetic protein FliR [Woodsholea maritima]|uniref:flagellar biosynthetic protein FliR n=1 Tax=Woodsholea maritima TaxID=240237 RepID=UPI0014614E35|nr:flagellar biosynthetic protein FliR [Woodsholea maritima]
MSTLIIALRLIPAVAFSPPFTLIRVPSYAKITICIIMALLAVQDYGLQSERMDTSLLLSAAVGELIIGSVLALFLQFLFAAIYFVGRTLDIQAGFGLALLADPTLNNQTPLLGTFLAYGMAALFFLTNAHFDFLYIWYQSLAQYPVGSVDISSLNIEPLLSFINSIFFMSLGLVSLVLAPLFIVDLSIAYISRTLPQMNVLLLGFQVKTIVVLVFLPFVFTVSSVVFLKTLRFTINSIYHTV